MSDIKTILATDCGSTTTKGILIEKREDGYHLVTRGEAPTTVEAPFDDVTVGVRNAVSEIEELANRKILADGKVQTPVKDGAGVDLFLSTSSAGGGLQMTVTGVVKTMSAESAQRAALGAGAIIMDTIAVDDGRKEYEKIERIRTLRPDMILISGGTDGGTVTHLVGLAEILLAADPRPRLGIGLKIPVIFAGNKDAREAVAEVIGDKVDLRIVDNLRPALEQENLYPAREAIHELFLEHVMQQAPGYSKLMDWVSTGIMSTPNAVGKIIQTIAEQNKINVLAVDIGGATTDVFSVFNNNFTRTVSANLGMSYSICNVLTEAGVANISRWVPFEVSEPDLRNILRNKMIRPTTVPQTLKDLLIEQAVCREALRLAFIHHKELARGLNGVQQTRTIGEMFTQDAGSGKSLVDLMSLDLIVGSGGVLSHAPRREQSALMMMDAYQPEGITHLAVDSIFMMPQLGILSTVLPEAASQVFERDCLIRLGTCVAPTGSIKEGETAVTFEFDGRTETVPFGAIKVLSMTADDIREIEFKPARGLDLGAGKGKPVKASVQGGVAGLIIDTRGRPLNLPSENAKRIAKLNEWLKAFNLPTAE